MSWEEVLSLIEQGEGQSLEFEKQVTTEEDIAREMVAFSNTNGGRVVFGIDDKNKHFIGAEIQEGFVEWVMKIARERSTPPITPKLDILERNEKKIVILSISEGDEKPYMTDDICYIRDDDLSRPATPEEQEEIKSPWSGIGMNQRQKKALHYIVDHGLITNREFRNLFNVSHKTAHIELTMLTDQGVLASQGLGRSTRYILAKGINELLQKNGRDLNRESNSEGTLSQQSPQSQATL